MKQNPLPYHPVAPLFMTDQKRIETLGQQADRAHRLSESLAWAVVACLVCVAIVAAAHVQRGGV